MSKTKIKIEVVHDVVCSWCAIGNRHLAAALDHLTSKVEAEIKYLPFELNRDMEEGGETIESHLMRRNAWTMDQFLSYRADLILVAKKAGLHFDYSKRTHYYNTAKAHRLIHFAEKFGKQSAIVEALTVQYFTHGMDVSNEERLLDVADWVGLDLEATKHALTSECLNGDIEKKYERAKAFLVRSIPAFIINDNDFISGSNSVEFFIQYFTNLVGQE